MLLFPCSSYGNNHTNPHVILQADPTSLCCLLNENRQDNDNKKTKKKTESMMPMEILKPYSAWGGQSVLHIVWGVCHTVPSPEHSQQDRQVKERGMGVSTWIWLLGHPQLRCGLAGM